MNSEPFVAIEDGGEKSGMLQGQPERVMTWTKAKPGITGGSPASEKAITAELKKLVSGIMDDTREDKRMKAGACRCLRFFLVGAIPRGCPRLFFPAVAPAPTPRFPSRIGILTILRRTLFDNKFVVPGAEEAYDALVSSPPGLTDWRNHSHGQSLEKAYQHSRIQRGYYAAPHRWHHHVPRV